MTAVTPERSTVSGYRAFPNMESRNFNQEMVEIPLMCHLLDLPLDARVLEIGCGRGIALPVFTRLLRPRSLTAIDIDAELVDLARRRSEEQGIVADVQRADVRRLPFPRESFDLVIDFGTCYHISQASRALGEIARVLVPGGFFAYETVASQLLSHPIRSFGRRIPWPSVPALRPDRHAGLWATRRKHAVR